MIVYKIQYVIFKREKNKEVTRDSEEVSVIINNLGRAKEVFAIFKNRCNQVSYLKGYSGRCELFIPHLFDNGELAYWPDRNEYIERYEF